MKSPASVDFIRESLITLLSDSLDKIAGFVAFVYFANYFTTDAFGAAYTVIAISMMAGSAPKAVSVAVSKRVSEDTRTHDEYFLLGVGSVIGFVAIAAMAAAVVLPFTSSEFEFLAIAGLVHLGTRPFLYHVERVFDGVGKTGAAASLDFVDGVLTALLRFVLILGLGLGAEGLLYSGAISAVGVGAVAYLYQFGVPSTLPTVNTAASIKEYGGWTLIARISGSVFHNLPTMLAGVLISPTLASWVRSAQTLCMPGDLPTRSIIKSVFVQVSGDLERGEFDINPLQNGLDIATVIAIPIVAGALVLGDAIMPLVFGSGYENTGYILFAVALARVFEQQARIFMSTLNGADQPDAAAKTNLTHSVVWGLVFATVMTVASVSAYLVALVLAYASWATVAYWFLGQRVVETCRLSNRFVGEQAVAAGAMAISVHLFSSEVGLGTRPALAVTILFGGVVYATVLLAISSRGKRIARTVLQRVVAA